MGPLSLRHLPAHKDGVIAFLAKHPSPALHFGMIE